MDNVKLFINGQQVDFSSDPKILYTYQTTDVTNPTVVKNSFSKTLTIEGTPNNNDIFGHYWNIERYILNGGKGGAYYNSSKKAPFELFVGSDLYEEGYVKLNNIQRKDGELKYSVTLYGGLGDFFYNLATSENGDSRKLSDLTYMSNGGENEFDFTVNINTVKEAWDALSNNTSGKWQYINFMPAYNGKPDDFDADKVVMNLSGTSLSQTYNADDKKNYKTKNGITIGTLPQEMTEWDIRDLRSYLQRPCIRMKEIINACCNPDNNGGYTVNLDPDFFSDDNPYWSNTWLSLSMTPNLEYSNEQQILEDDNIFTLTTTGETNGLMYQDIGFELGEINGNVNNITVQAKIKLDSLNALYHSSSYVWFWNWNGDSYHTGFWCLGSLFCQLVAVNGETVVGASDVFNLTTPVRHNGSLWYGHNGHYPESTGYDSNGLRKMGNGSQYIPYMDKQIYNVLGDFYSDGFRREGENNAYPFTFTIKNIGTNVTGLKMVYYWGATADKVKKCGSSSAMFDNDPNTNANYSNGWITYTMGWHTLTEVDRHNLDITYHNLTSVIGASLGRTGTKITKKLLLNTESSPCDYLLSYCKMFGLHFTKDIGSKTINILTRKSFYERENIVDLEQYIDRSQQIEILPIMFKSKWYQFIQEKDETDVSKKYLTAKGVEYGSKVLDTGYEFNAEKIDLLEDNCIKAGIEVLEKSKWYTAYNNDSSLRPWMNVGLKYTLWNGDDEYEMNAGIGSSGDIIPINEGQGMKYYDVYPKLQFHDSDNAPTDGNNCLVFFSGFKDITSGRTNPLTYILSDDNVYQTAYNEGTPCWLFTKYEVVDNRRLCWKLDKLPVFERYLTSTNSGTISKSLDFGSAQELYVPNYSLTDDTNIYHNFWRTYLSDLFDVNTRQMTCYVKIDTNPGIDWLKRFYWFDNSIWTINKISDWNPASEETTKCEFIKVQDIDNYTSVTQGKPNTIELSADRYNVSDTGGTVTLYVSGLTAGVTWRLSMSGDASVSFSGYSTTATTITGTGNGSVRVIFGENYDNSLKGQMFRVIRNDNAVDASIYVSQGYEGEKSFVATPEDLIIPASGGSYIIDFTWTNQGDSYVDFVDYNEGSDCLQFTADTDTYKYENKAVLTFGPNTGDTVLHNYCTFKLRDDHSVYSSIGLDQLPESYSFSGEGQTQVLATVYSSGATFEEVPYWVDMVNNGDGSFNIVAETNTGDAPRSGVTTIELYGNKATFVVNQNIIGAFNVTRTDGSGNVLVTGGTIQLKVTSTTAWTGTSNVNWATLSSSSASTSSTITATFGNNTGETRDATFTFTNASGEVITYTQTQAGKDGSQSMVDPEILVFDATGGTSAVTVSIPNVWRIVAYSPWLSFSASSGASPTTINITASPQSSQEERQGVVVFYDTVSTKSYLVTVIQGGAQGEILAVSPSRLRFPASGGTILLTIISNTDWTIA